jgi:hypothetical protein
MKQISRLAALMVFCFGLRANADLMLEPYLGYEFGSLTGTPVIGSAGTAKTTMIDFGARIGVDIPGGFWVAGDVLLGTAGTFKPDNGTDSKTTRTDLGVTAGFDFPMLFKVYGGYVLVANSTIETNGQTITFKEGTGYKLGAGYKIAPMVNINLEYYIYNTPKKFEAGPLSGDVSTIYSKWEETGYRIVLSIPIM